MKTRTLFFLVLLLFNPSFAARAAEVNLDMEAQKKAGIMETMVLEKKVGHKVHVVGVTRPAPGSTMMIKPVIQGRVRRVLVRTGDEVGRGQALVMLSSSQLTRMQADYLLAGGRLGLARGRLEAGEQLYKLEGISLNELKQREQAVLVARLEKDEARQGLLDLGLNPAQLRGLEDRQKVVDVMTITAPAAGMVMEVMAHDNEWVPAGQALVKMGDPKRLELEIMLPAEQAGRVRPGNRLVFRPVGRPEMKGEAEIISRLPMVDPQTRSVSLLARILKSEGACFAGSMIEGELDLGGDGMVLSVPESALIGLGDRQVVFVRKGPETFEARPVSTGRNTDGQVEIINGLQPGEKVVNRGVFYLKAAMVRNGG